MSDIGERIKQLRSKNGLTQENFANSVGVDRATINRYEKGKLDPGGSILQRIVSSFPVDACWLLTGQKFQEEAKPADNIEVAEKRDTYNKDTEGAGVKGYSLLTRAAEILDSNSIFGQTLAANINAFHLAIRSEEKILSLQGRIDYLGAQNKSLESRLVAVEEKLKGG